MIYSNLLVPSFSQSFSGHHGLRDHDGQRKASNSKYELSLVEVLAQDIEGI
jgi:hypothetical protein